MHFRLLSLNNSKVFKRREKLLFYPKKKLCTTFHIKLIIKKSLGIKKNTCHMVCMSLFSNNCGTFCSFHHFTREEKALLYPWNTLQDLLSHDELPETVYFERERNRRKRKCAGGKYHPSANEQTSTHEICFLIKEYHTEAYP